MDKRIITLLLILYALILQTLAATWANCTFPAFLYQTFNKKPKIWVTKTRFHMKSTTWDSKRQVTVTHDTINVKSLFKAQCKQNNCYHSEVEYRQSCYRQYEADKNTYIVSQMMIGSGQASYLCIRFVKLADKIVQVWRSDSIGYEDKTVCQPRRLKREDWPWISSDIIDKAIPCPIYGGYDFRAYEGPRRKQICPDSWRTFRIEAQCLPGDGIQFIFPKGCNFLFSNHRNAPEETTLYCYAHWTEERYQFLLMGSGIGDTAQYVLRLPDDSELRVRRFAPGQPHMMGIFTAELYFNPIAPIADQGEPPRNVVVVDLRLHRSGTEYCTDETDQCDSRPAREFCNNYDQANYCKRTCGICVNMPSIVVECHFPQETRRNWIAFDGSEEQEVRVGTGLITLENIGNLTCKANFPGKPHHKLLILFNNGCRPRYTCMRIEAARHNLIEFRMAQGHRIDLSEKMCYFHEASPIYPKGIPSQIGFAKELVSRGTCGLEGYVSVTVQNREQRCMGYVSDWDSAKCQRVNKLTLVAPKCSIVKQNVQVFRCIAHIQLSHLRSVLITEPLENNSQISCWAITTQSANMHYKPWRQVKLLTHSPCGKSRDFLDDTALTIQVLKSTPERPCKPEYYTLFNNYAQSTTWSYKIPDKHVGVPDNSAVSTNGVPSVHLSLLLFSIISCIHTVVTKLSR